MAERISHAVETYGLLPTNHFGARKQRSAEQALVLLQEQIYTAWRGRRILSLVSVLEDASRTSRAIGEPELSNICTQMARQVEEMAESYQNPSDKQLDTIRKLTKAFEMAKTAKAQAVATQVSAAEVLGTGAAAG